MSNIDSKVYEALADIKIKCTEELKKYNNRLEHQCNESYLAGRNDLAEQIENIVSEFYEEKKKDSIDKPIVIDTLPALLKTLESIGYASYQDSNIYLKIKAPVLWDLRAHLEEQNNKKIEFLKSRIRDIVK